ncbi:MAG: energy-coupling factor transporter transmembrane component T [Syntrophales bacterium]|jgi:energy-coupling factor transporter transmembrane protein EcfT
MKNNLPPFLLMHAADLSTSMEGTIRESFLEKGINSISRLIQTGLSHAGGDESPGLFQGLDARIKLAFLLSFLIVISLKHSAAPQLAITGIITVGMILSRLRLRWIVKRVIPFTFFFGFIIALPASLNMVTPGKIVVPVVDLSMDYNFWIYHIPRNIGFTREGIEMVTILSLKVMNSLALSWLIISTTPLSEIMRALKVFYVPDGFLLIVTLSNHYIFSLSRTVLDMYQARRSRTIRPPARGEGQRWIAGRMVHIFERSIARYEVVYKAMQGRGVSESYHLPGFFPMAVRSRVAGLVMTAVGILLLFI